MHTTEVNKLGELQTKLDALRAHRRTLERQKAQLNDTLESIAARRGPLTREHAKGDATAAKRLDDLDFEERSMSRSLEGVEGNLAANLAEIQPVEIELSAESALEAARQGKAEWDAFEQRTLAKRDKVMALALELQRDYTELQADLYDAFENRREMGGGTGREG